MTTGNNAKNNVQKSFIPGAIIMPQEQHYFLKEQAFTQSKQYSFAAAEIKWFYFDPTNYVPGVTQILGRIIAEVPSFFAAAGPLEVKFYSNPTLGAAVASPLVPGPFNRVGGSALAAQLELSDLNQAPDDFGVGPYSEILVPANATGAGQQVGFSVAEALPFALDLTGTILMTVKNLDGADTLVGIRNTWFEI